MSIKRISILVLPILILIVCSCVSPETQATDTESGEPDNESTQTSTSGSGETGETGEPLPFTLLIDGQSVGPDLPVIVPEGRALDIQFATSEPKSSDLSIIYENGDAFSLGIWDTGEAAFSQSFPPGENHVILRYGDTFFDFIVEAVAEGPESNGEGCMGAFIDVSPDARWEYREEIEGQFPVTWFSRIEDWSRDPDGVTRFNRVIERVTGIEQRTVSTAILELSCADGTVMITRAIDRIQEAEQVTVYDENSIYVPADISEGTAWERRGVHTGAGGDESFIFNLTERLVCTGRERITVEAGEFEAFRVEYSVEESSPDETLTRLGISWYVPGIGRILSIGGPDGNLRLELISYEGVEPGE